MLKEFPLELIEKVTIPALSYEQIIEACRDEDSEIFSLCDKKSFWINKLEYDMEKENLDFNEMLIDSSIKRRIKYVLILVITFDADPLYNNASSLIEASKRGYADIVEILLSNVNQGEKITVEEILFYRPTINDALIRGDVNVLRVLLKNKGNGLFSQKSRDEGLLEASSKGQIELVKFLIEEAGAYPGYNNSSAIIYAVKSGNAKIIKFLLKYGSIDPSAYQNRAIIEAATNGHTDIVKLLMEDERVDPSASNNDALLFAITGKYYFNIIKLLLKDPRVKPTEFTLNYIIEYNLLKIMKILLSDETRDYIKILPKIKTKKKPSKDMLNLILGYITGNITKESLRREEEIYTKTLSYWRGNLSRSENHIQFLKRNKSFDISIDRAGIMVKLLKGSIKDFIAIYFLSIRAYLEVYSKWIRIVFQLEPKSDVSIITIREKNYQEQIW